VEHAQCAEQSMRRGIVCRLPGILPCIRCTSVGHLSLSCLTTVVAHLVLVWRSRCCVLLCIDARCLSLSCLTPVRRFRHVVFDRYARTRPVLFCLGHCLAGHQKDRFSLGNGTTSAVASAVCRGRGSQPWPSEKCDPHQWWKTALTIALVASGETCFDEATRA